MRETKGSKWISLGFGLETRWVEIPFTETGKLEEEQVWAEDQRILGLSLWHAKFLRERV